MLAAPLEIGLTRPDQGPRAWKQAGRHQAESAEEAKRANQAYGQGTTATNTGLQPCEEGVPKLQGHVTVIHA